MLLQTRAARAIGTWFGCGYSPVASGTVGALGALPLYWLLRQTHPVAYVAWVLAITAVGTWAAHRVAQDVNEEDPSCVVIDEVAGTLIALGIVRDRSLAVQAAAWLLFRALDVLKPGPIGRAERARPAGLGIMLDDVLAGAVAGCIARLL